MLVPTITKTTSCFNKVLLVLISVSQWAASKRGRHLVPSHPNRINLDVFFRMKIKKKDDSEVVAVSSFSAVAPTACRLEMGKRTSDWERGDMVKVCATTLSVWRTRWDLLPLSFLSYFLFLSCSLVLTPLTSGAAAVPFGCWLEIGKWWRATAAANSHIPFISFPLVFFP